MAGLHRFVIGILRQTRRPGVPVAHEFLVFKDDNRHKAIVFQDSGKSAADRSTIIGPANIAELAIIAL